MFVKDAELSKAKAEQKKYQTRVTSLGIRQKHNTGCSCQCHRSTRQKHMSDFGVSFSFHLKVYVFVLCTAWPVQDSSEFFSM